MNGKVVTTSGVYLPKGLSFLTSSSATSRATQNDEQATFEVCGQVAHFVETSPLFISCRLASAEDCRDYCALLFNSEPSLTLFAKGQTAAETALLLHFPCIKRLELKIQHTDRRDYLEVRIYRPLRWQWHQKYSLFQRTVLGLVSVLALVLVLSTVGNNDITTTSNQ